MMTSKRERIKQNINTGFLRVPCIALVVITHTLNDATSCKNKHAAQPVISRVGRLLFVEEFKKICMELVAGMDKFKPLNLCEIANECRVSD